jgi:hypothetical protein
VVRLSNRRKRRKGQKTRVFDLMALHVRASNREFAEFDNSFANGARKFTNREMATTLSALKKFAMPLVEVGQSL